MNDLRHADRTSLSHDLSADRFHFGRPRFQGTVDGWRMAHRPTTAGDGDRQPILRVERIHVTAADTGGR
jgi:hypothetical protein